MIPSPHILMCPPDYYGIEYEINPWMDRRRQVDHARAVRQWTELRGTVGGARGDGFVPGAGRAACRTWCLRPTRR